MTRRPIARNGDNFQNPMTPLPAGSRWLGAQAVAAVAVLVSDGTVDVAGTLELSSGSAASQHQQLLLFPPIWVWAGVQEL